MINKMLKIGAFSSENRETFLNNKDKNRSSKGNREKGVSTVKDTLRNRSVYILILGIILLGLVSLYVPLVDAESGCCVNLNAPNNRCVSIDRDSCSTDNGYIFYPGKLCSSVCLSGGCCVSSSGVCSTNLNLESCNNPRTFVVGDSSCTSDLAQQYCKKICCVISSGGQNINCQLRTISECQAYPQQSESFTIFNDVNNQQECTLKCGDVVDLNKGKLNISVFRNGVINYQNSYVTINGILYPQSNFYSIYELPIGVYRVTAYSEGFISQTNYSINLVNGITTKVKFNLIPAMTHKTTVIGKVKDINSRAISNALVTAGSSWAFTDQNGDYSFDVILSAGQNSLTINVKKDGYSSNSVSISNLKYDIVYSGMDIVLQTETSTAVCGNNIKEANEQCDGTDDSLCDGYCMSGKSDITKNCRCPLICGQDAGYVAVFKQQCILAGGQEINLPNQNNLSPVRTGTYLGLKYGKAVCCTTPLTNVNIKLCERADQSGKQVKMTSFGNGELEVCKCGNNYIDTSEARWQSAYCCGDHFQETPCLSSTLEGTVTNGSVTDRSTGKVSNAQVMVSNPSGLVFKTAVTNQNGFYSIGELPIGTYTIIISKPGYTQNISTLSITGASKYTRNAIIRYNKCLLDLSANDVKLNISIIKGKPCFNISWQIDCNNYNTISLSKEEIISSRTLSSSHSTSTTHNQDEMNNIFTLDDLSSNKGYYLDCKATNGIYENKWETSYKFTLSIDKDTQQNGENIINNNINNQDVVVEKTAFTGNIYCKNRFDETRFCYNSSCYLDYNTRPLSCLVNNEPILNFGSGANSIVYCDKFNNLLQQSPGGDCGEGFCRILNEATKTPVCVGKEKCIELGIFGTGFGSSNEKLSNFFGLFYDQEYSIANGNNNERVKCEENTAFSLQKDKYRYCSMDSIKGFRVEDNYGTSIDVCKSCDLIPNCFYYSSKEACLRDNCKIGNANGIECKWYGNIEFMSDLGHGFCYPSKRYPNNDLCSTCSNEDVSTNNLNGKNIFFRDNCNYDVCYNLGMCYTNAANDVCKSCTATTKCEDFQDQRSCNGGTNFNKNNLLSECGSGFNFIYSKDACEIGLCKWINNPSSNGGLCIKDNNGDGQEDCTLTLNSETCKQDNIPPVTTMINIPEFVSTTRNRNLQFTLTGGPLGGQGGSDSYYCVSNKTEGCCPNIVLMNNILTLTGATTLDLLNQNTEWLKKLDGEYVYLNYFSIDSNKNIEQIKTTRLFVDMKAPVISIISKLRTNKVGSDILSDLLYNLSVNENSVCGYNFKMIQIEGETITTEFNRQQSLGVFEPSNRYKSISINSIPDGLYQLNISCTDEKGNSGDKIDYFFVNRFTKIISYSPMPLTTNATSMQISVQTSDDLNCIYHYNGMDYTFPQTGRMYNLYNYSTTLLDLRTGRYIIPITCENRDISNEISRATIIFTVDQSGPILSEYYDLGTGVNLSYIDIQNNLIESGLDTNLFNGIVVSNPIVRLNYSDPPLNLFPQAFGLRNYYYCINISPITCTQFKPFVDNTKIFNSYPSGRYNFCYYGTDKGGNIGPTICRDVIVDKNGPYVYLNPQRYAATSNSKTQISGIYRDYNIRGITIIQFADGKTYSYDSILSRQNQYNPGVDNPFSAEVNLVSGKNMFYAVAEDIGGNINISNNISIYYDTVGPEANISIFNNNSEKINNQLNNKYAEYGTNILFNFSVYDLKNINLGNTLFIENNSGKLRIKGTNLGNSYNSRNYTVNITDSYTHNMFYLFKPTLQNKIYDLKPGNYSAIFTARDTFGNLNTVQSSFSVKDTTPPKVNIIIKALDPSTLIKVNDVSKITYGEYEAILVFNEPIIYDPAHPISLDYSYLGVNISSGSTVRKYETLTKLILVSINSSNYSTIFKGKFKLSKLDKTLEEIESTATFHLSACDKFGLNCVNQVSSGGSFIIDTKADYTDPFYYFTTQKYQDYKNFYYDQTSKTLFVNSDFEITGKFNSPYYNSRATFVYTNRLPVVGFNYNTDGLYAPIIDMSFAILKSINLMTMPDYGIDIDGTKYGVSGKFRINQQIAQNTDDSFTLITPNQILGENQGKYFTFNDNQPYQDGDIRQPDGRYFTLNRIQDSQLAYFNPSLNLIKEARQISSPIIIYDKIADPGFFSYNLRFNDSNKIFFYTIPFDGLNSKIDKVDYSKLHTAVLDKYSPIVLDFSPISSTLNNKTDLMFKLFDSISGVRIVNVSFYEISLNDELIKLDSAIFDLPYNFNDLNSQYGFEITKDHGNYNLVYKTLSRYPYGLKTGNYKIKLNVQDFAGNKLSKQYLLSINPGYPHLMYVSQLTNDTKPKIRIEFESSKLTELNNVKLKCGVNGLADHSNYNIIDLTTSPLQGTKFVLPVPTELREGTCNLIFNAKKQLLKTPTSELWGQIANYDVEYVVDLTKPGTGSLIPPTEAITNETSIYVNYEQPIEQDIINCYYQSTEIPQNPDLNNPDLVNLLAGNLLSIDRMSPFLLSSLFNLGLIQLKTELSSIVPNKIFVKCKDRAGNLGNTVSAIYNYDSTYFDYDIIMPKYTDRQNYDINITSLRKELKHSSYLIHISGTTQESFEEPYSDNEVINITSMQILDPLVNTYVGRTLVINNQYSDVLDFTLNTPDGQVIFSLPPTKGYEYKIDKEGDYSLVYSTALSRSSILMIKANSAYALNNVLHKNLDNFNQITFEISEKTWPMDKLFHTLIKNRRIFYDFNPPELISLSVNDKIIDSKNSPIVGYDSSCNVTNDIFECSNKEYDFSANTALESDKIILKGIVRDSLGIDATYPIKLQFKGDQSFNVLTNLNCYGIISDINSLEVTQYPKKCSFEYLISDKNNFLAEKTYELESYEFKDITGKTAQIQTNSNMKFRIQNGIPLLNYYEAIPSTMLIEDNKLTAYVPNNYVRLMIHYNSELSNLSIDTELPYTLVTQNMKDYEVLLSTLTEKEYKLNLEAKSAINNKTSIETIYLKPDMTLPVINGISTNAINGKVRSSTLKLSTFVNDENLNYVKINNDFVANKNGTINHDITLNPGNNNVVVYAEDKAGNYASYNIIVYYDVINPQINILSKQFNNNFVWNFITTINSPLNINYIVNDMIKFNDNLNQNRLITVRADDNLNLIKAIGIDEFGNSYESNKIIAIVDSEAPIFKLENPTYATTVSENNIIASIRIFDRASGINSSSVIFKLGGVNYSASYNSETGRYYSQLNGLINGANTIKVYAKDMAGNSGSYEYTIYLDNTSAKISWDVKDYYATSLPALNFEFDRQIELVSAEINNLDIKPYISTSDRKKFRIDLPNELVCDLCNIKVKVTSAYLSEVSYFKTFIIDKNKPQMVLSKDEYLSKDAELFIAGSIREDNLKSVDLLKINSSVQISPNRAGDYYNFIIRSNLEEGYNFSNNIYEIEAEDLAGNKILTPLKIIYDNTIPRITQTDVSNSILRKGIYYTSSDYVKIGGYYSSDNKVLIRANGRAAEINGNTFKVEVGLKGESGQQVANNIELTIEDKAGNIQKQTIVVVKDLLGPAVFIASNAQLLNNLNPEMIFNTSEPTIGCKLSYFNKGIRDIQLEKEENGQYRYTFNERLSMNKKYDLTLSCIDELYNLNTQIIQISTDIELPQIQVSSTSGELKSNVNNVKRYYLYRSNSTTLSVTSNEDVKCKYSTTTSDYDLMNNSFVSNQYATSAISQVLMFKDLTTNRIYVSCEDRAGNIAVPILTIFEVQLLDKNHFINYQPEGYTNQKRPIIKGETRFPTTCRAELRQTGTVAYLARLVSNMLQFFTGSEGVMDQIVNTTTNRITHYVYLSGSNYASRDIQDNTTYNIQINCIENAQGIKASSTKFNFTTDFKLDRFNITYPTSGIDAQTAVITVRGYTESTKPITKVSIKVNGILQIISQNVMDDGSFAFPVVLTNGTNQIEVKATDRAGNFQVGSVNVYYGRKIPFVDFIYPSNGEKLVNVSQFIAGIVGTTNLNSTQFILYQNNIEVGRNNLGTLSTRKDLFGNDLVTLKLNMHLDMGDYRLIVIPKSAKGDDGIAMSSYFTSLNSLYPVIILDSPYESLPYHGRKTNLRNVIVSGLIKTPEVITEGYVLMNGVKKSFTEERFSQNMTVISGKNYFEIYAINTLGKESKTIGSIDIDYIGPSAQISVE